MSISKIISYSFVLFVTSFLFTGCSFSKPINYSENSHLKAYEDEDIHILQMLQKRAEGRVEDELKLYETMYRRSAKLEYLYGILEINMGLKKYSYVEQRIKREFKVVEKIPRLQRYLINSYIKRDMFAEAKREALKLLESTKAQNDYVLLSTIYFGQSHYKMALRYLDSAYVINYNEEILEKIASLLYFYIGDKPKAISLLESHSRLHGCSRLVCVRLSEYYNKENNFEGMLSIYKRLYKKFNEFIYADAIIKLYSYKKELVNLQLFLEDSGANNRFLVEVYANQKKFKKASALAYKLYIDENDFTMLGKSALFDYEGAEDKSDKLILNRVVKNLNIAVKNNQSSLYLNYLGYLLIDHDIDVDSGIVYVKRALSLDPESAFYLDSLAWGYYKKRECKDAYKIMKKVVDKIGLEETEVKEHWEAIKGCKY